MQFCLNNDSGQLAILKLLAILMLTPLSGGDGTFREAMAGIRARLEPFSIEPFSLSHFPVQIFNPLKVYSTRWSAAIETAQREINLY